MFRLSTLFTTLVAITLLLSSNNAFAQSAEILYSDSSEYDTNYVKTYPDFISTRLYLSRKFTGIRFESSAGLDLDYLPNTTLNLGIGATVSGFTLNLAYGFKFLNENEERGETRYLDLQSRIFGKEYAIDLFGQFYSGMYLDNSDEVLDFPADSFYTRSDLNLFLIGGSYFHIHSSDRFSYSASLVQNEWQKRSAGSLLYGGKAVFMAAAADSSFIPPFGRDSVFSAMQNVESMSSFQIGPGIGYAHTFVVDHHWFFTVSLELNLMFGNISYSTPDSSRQREWQTNPSADLKLALGYNSARTYFGISYVQDNSQISSLDNSVSAIFSVGNVRINYVKRFLMGPKLRKFADWLPS